MKSLLKVVFIAVSVLAGARLAQAQSGWKEHIKETKFTLSEAIDKAAKAGEADASTVFHAELEVDSEMGGRLLYSIDFAQGNKTCNVILDPKNGDVVKKETEDEDFSGLIKASKVTLKDATATALKEVEGTAIESQLYRWKGKLLVVVKIFDGTTRKIVHIDAVTGKVHDRAAGKSESGSRDKDKKTEGEDKGKGEDKNTKGKGMQDDDDDKKGKGKGKKDDDDDDDDDKEKKGKGKMDDDDDD